VIDSVDAAQLGGFWSQLLERPLIDGANQFFAVIPPASDGSFPALMFLAVPEPRQGKNRQHLDLVSADPAGAVERAIALGATKISDFDEYGTQWTTLADPEGNCLRRRRAARRSAAVARSGPRSGQGRPLNLPRTALNRAQRPRGPASARSSVKE
jgi:hypothetical protein